MLKEQSCNSQSIPAKFCNAGKLISLPFFNAVCIFPFRLKPLDIEFMKQLHNKVNIVPVIGKADTLTPTELVSMKRRVSYLMMT